MSKPLFLFCHVPKCSGMTVILTFRTIYGDKNVWLDDDFNPPPPNICAIVGHFRSHKYDEIFPDVPKITFLRDPVERLMSNYYFHKRSRFPLPRAWWVNEVRAGKMDVLEYAPYEKNVLSHYVSREQVDTFTIVGLTEKFEESMKVFFDMFNDGQKVLVDPYNKNLQRTTPRYDLPKDVRKKLEKIHEEDYEVYRRAQEIWPGMGISL